MKKTVVFFVLILVSPFYSFCQKGEWKSMFNGKNLDGWTIRGKAAWKVSNGVMIGEGANGHIYAAPELTDLEVKGTFRLSDQGGGGNSGLYFPPKTFRVPPLQHPKNGIKGPFFCAHE